MVVVLNLEMLLLLRWERLYTNYIYGMIGSHIVHHSLSASHETFILDRNNSLSQRLGTTNPYLQ